MTISQRTEITVDGVDYEVIYYEDATHEEVFVYAASDNSLVGKADIDHNIEYIQVTYNNVPAFVGTFAPATDEYPYYDYVASNLAESRAQVLNLAEWIVATSYEQ